MENKTYAPGDNVTIAHVGDEFDGQQVEVLKVSSHQFGVDLRVRTDDDAEFWTCSSNVL